MAGQETPAPLAPLTDPAAATAPTNIPSAPALAQGQQQAGRMYTLDPNYRPQQEQRIRPQVKQTGFLGDGQVAQARASGGDPLFAATLAVPTLELDRSLQSIQRQKDDIEKWMADVTTQFKGRAADPYQKAYQDYVSQEHNKFFDDVAQNYYGGNRSKAIQAVRRDPELNRQFMNMNRSLGAIGDANKTGYNYYEKVADSVLKGETEVDPETRRLLDQGLNGEWAFNGMGPAHNAAQFDRLNDRLSMNKLFDSFYEKNVNSSGDVKADQWSVVTEGDRKFLVIPKEKNYDEFVNSFVEQAMKDAPYRDEAEVRRFVEARVPRENTVDVDELSLGTGGSSQANKKPSVGFAEVGFDATVPGLHQVEGDGFKRRTPMSISMPLKDGDNKPFTESFRFNDSAGTPMRIIPDGFRLNDKGEVFIVGRNADVTQTETKDAEKLALLKARVDDSTALLRKAQDAEALTDKAKADKEKSVAMYTENRDKYIKELSEVEREVTKEKPPVPIPLKGNEAKVKTYFGEQVFNDVMQQAAAVKRQRKESKPFIDPTMPPSYNKVKAKLPPGATQADFDEAMKTPEGRAYIESLK